MAKHVFIVDRHYWPDTNPLAVMLPKIVDWLAEEGSTATVLTAKPGYKPDQIVPSLPFVERNHGLTVIRLALFPNHWGHGFRYINYLLFIIAVVFMLPMLCVRKRAFSRYIMTATMPPII